MKWPPQAEVLPRGHTAQACEAVAQSPENNMVTVEALVTELLTCVKGSLEALPMMLEGLPENEKIVVHSAMYAMTNNIALALDKQGVMSADDFLHTVGVPKDIRRILAPTNEAFADENNA